MLAFFHTPSTRRFWMWALLPLLLAAALTIPLLDVDAFNGDEPASLAAAGLFRSEPLSLDETWRYVTNRDPDQAYGWPLMLSVWGHLVGWSEVAVRTLSLFFGVLALAWVYRTGRDLLSPQAGLFATLLLGASVFFHAYMIHARAFTLVALCTTLCVWSYWRIALHPRTRCRKAQFGLLLGSAGLLYMHYYGALFLLIPGMFHLLFVPKNRRWWQPVLLFGLAALLAMPQLPGFLQGLAMTAADEVLSNRALSAEKVVSYLAHYLTNGLLGPSSPLGVLLLIILPCGLVAVYLFRLRQGNRNDTIWLLVFTSCAFLALTIVVNEVVKVLEANRIRYLMPLWPLTALLAGAGLWRLARRNRHIVASLLILWVLIGAWLILATEFRYETGNFFHTVPQNPYRVLRNRIPASDLLVLDMSVARLDGRMFSAIDERIYRYKPDPYEMVRSIHTDWTLLSLLYLTKDRVGFADLPTALGRVFCERLLEESGLTLDRYALHSVENCPDSPARLVFDSDIQLTVPKISIQNGLLRLDAHFRSADAQFLANYSFAVHVFDTRGERVAQGDTGVGPGAIVPLRSEIDVSSLPPGDYDVRVALYNWQTGVRLQARDLETDEVSDMHTLHRFRHD